jgi:AraC-like DNA-binding protein/mannose-6-phosphate isomerase-like protein (cupin superfamily)
LLIGQNEKNRFPKKIPEYALRDYFDTPVNVHFDIDGLSTPLTELLPNVSTPHRHDFFSLYFIKNGTGTHYIDFSTYELKPYTVFFLSPHNIHKWQNVRRISGSCLSFNEEFYRKQFTGKSIFSEFNFLYSFMNKPFLQAEKRVFEKFEILLKLMSEEQKDGNLFKNEITVNLLRTLLYLLRDNIAFRQAHISGRYRDIEQTFLMIREVNFMNERKPSFYAAELNITVEHLCAVLKEMTGKSTSELINGRIILEAKRMLLNSGKTISEIAESLGFVDVSYFSRFFKMNTSFSPTDFIQANL